MTSYLIHLNTLVVGKFIILKYLLTIHKIKCISAIIERLRVSLFSTFVAIIIFNICCKGMLLYVTFSNYREVFLSNTVHSVFYILLRL